MLSVNAWQEAWDEGFIWPHNLRIHGQKDIVVWVSPCTGDKCVGTFACIRAAQRNRDEKWRSSLSSFYPFLLGWNPNSWDVPIHFQRGSSIYLPWKHFHKHTQLVSREIPIQDKLTIKLSIIGTSSSQNVTIRYLLL